LSGELYEEPIIIEFFNTSESPLWHLAERYGRYLADDECHVPESYWMEKAKVANAKLVIILNQLNGDSSIIAFDECGHPIQI